MTVDNVEFVVGAMYLVDGEYKMCLADMAETTEPDGKPYIRLDYQDVDDDFSWEFWYGPNDDCTVAAWHETSPVYCEEGHVTIVKL
jgi:hypothetical protein